MLQLRSAALAAAPAQCRAPTGARRVYSRSPRGRSRPHTAAARRGHGQSREKEEDDIPTAGRGGQQQPQQQQQGGPAQWVERASRWWAQELTPSQQAFAVVALLGLLAIAPRVLLVPVVALERVVVGGLLAVEELAVEFVFRTAALVRPWRCSGPSLPNGASPCAYLAACVRRAPFSASCSSAWSACGSSSSRQTPGRGRSSGSRLL